MNRLIVSVCLLFATAPAAFASCGQTANFAGCSGTNGTATYNKNSGAGHSYNRNTGQYHSSQSGSYYHPPQGGYYHRVAPGTSATGWRGNSATKAFQQGCAYVNGHRECR
jgi:hypothetical protein